MKQVLQLTNSLSIHFQKKNANYSSVGILTNATLLELESLRNDDSYKLFWTKSEQFATKEDIRLPDIPRKRKIPSRFGGGEATTINNISSYFKVSIYFPVLDIIINDIKTKFEENNITILNALQCCLSNKNCSDENILEVCNTYDIIIDDFKAELKLFSKMCLSSDIPENFENRLNFFLSKDLIGSFENMYKIFKIYLSIPMSSASSERSFSSLRRLKTFTRNTIGQERLSNIAILNIENMYPMNFDKIIDQFSAESTQRGRRLQLI